MRYAVCCITAMLAAICHGQDTVLWTTSPGGAGADGGRSIDITNDGGFVIAGFTFSSGAGHSDLLLVRTDPEGSVIWQNTFGGSGSDSGYGVSATTDGGFIATGFTTSFGSGDRDVFLVKSDAEGIEEWARSFGGNATDIGRSVIETSDGGYVICGSTQSFGDGEDKIYLIRTGPAGNELWSHTYGGAAEDNGRSVIETADGGFLLSGATGSFGGGNRDIWLVKVDAEGTEQWSQAYGNNSNFDWGSSAVATADGGFLAVGHGDVHGRELLSMILLRTDADGQTIWQKRFSEGFYDYGTACSETADGDFLALGTSKSAATLTNDVAVRKIDPSGNLLWSEIIGGEGSQSAFSFVEMDDGYIVVGSTDPTSSGSHDLWMAKISNLTPRFSANTSEGQAPLEVDFEDLSTGVVTAWRWDFDGDGVTDSQEQHPSWVYQLPGLYSVRLEVSSGSAIRTLIQEDLVTVTPNPRAPRRTSGRLPG